uniref:YeeE/YedE thiosulfate transporter family protein n=1 Tax=Marivita sp. TaxID=2003365 RepID=UPI003F6D6FBA
ETGRYAGGAVLMGAGGVLAGGSTVGAGLAGVPTLSFAALLAILSIAAGAIATDTILKTTRQSRFAHPAE